MGDHALTRHRLMGWRRKDRAPKKFDTPEHRKNGLNRKRFLKNQQRESDFGKKHRYRTGGGLERIE